MSQCDTLSKALTMKETHCDAQVYTQVFPPLPVLILPYSLAFKSLRRSLQNPCKVECDAAALQPK